MSDKKNNEQNSVNSIIADISKSRGVYLISFIVPLIIMIAIYIMREIYPFGSAVYLKSDMYHQYAPFFSALWEKIRTGKSLQYTWDVGMGTNFLAIFGYYLSSPSNWFIALFPQKHILEIMDFIIALKIALSSFTFTYYICHHKKERSMMAAVFGMFYALSGFVTAYSWNIMWLDSVVLFPLIILGLERLVYEGKGLLYTVTLGMAILSNYYIAIMICLSLVFYFLALIASMPVPERKSEYAKCILRFTLYSILSGAFAAVLLFPEMMALQYTASSSSTFPEKLTRYFSFIQMIKRQLINVKVHLGLDHWPNIYCGVMVLMLVPLYAMCKKIGKREKIVKFILLLIFLIGFNMNQTNYIWHGMHFPNSLPCRQSFIYVFILLGMCYDAAIEIREYKGKQLAGVFWGVMFFLMYIGDTLAKDDLVTFKNIYTTGIFILLYSLVILAIRKWKKISSILMIVIFSISIVEVTMNTESTGYSTTSRTDYLRDYDASREVLSQVANDDKDFYRLTKYRGYRSKNDATWHNFHSMSTFSSTAYAHITELYGLLGLEHSTNAYAINGATPVVYSLFNVKYLLTNEHMVENDIFTYYTGSDGEFIYKNNYALPVAYYVPSDFNTTVKLKKNDPFENQNMILYQATGIDGVLEEISFTKSGTGVTIENITDRFVYAYVNNKSVETVKANIGTDTKTFTGVNHGRGIDIGYVEAGDTINIFDSKNGTTDLQLSVYTVNMEKFKEAMNILKKNVLTVSSYDDNFIKGTVDFENDGYLFTSIPYDKSWTVYVDGKKTDYEKSLDALISVPLKAGTHKIEFIYKAAGFNPGLVISIISFIIVGGLIFVRCKFKIEISENGAMEKIMKAVHDKKSNKESEEK